MPKFFSRSCLLLYRRSSAYSPTILAATESPTKAELINETARKPLLVVVQEAKAIVQKEQPKIMLAVKMVASTPSTTINLLISGTETRVTRGLIDKIMPVIVPLTSYCFASKGKNTG